MLKIKVIGGGVGNLTYLTIYAQNLIKKAEVVLTSERFLNLKTLNANIISLTLSEILKQLPKYKNKNVAVVVSGDVGFYSFAKTLKEKFPLAQLEFVNGLSSLQYLMAKLHKNYNEVKTLSLHGRNKSIVPFVTYNEKLFVLTGGDNKVKNILEEICKFKLNNLRLTVGENLSQENERIISGSLAELLKLKFSDLAVMYFENENFTKTYEILKDEDFKRAKVPMTKKAVRDLVVSTLNISPTDVVYDIGAGSGSVSLALARKASESFVYAVEKNQEAVNLIKENILHLKTYNVEVFFGEALNIIATLPTPNKVFIGGSGGDLTEILNYFKAKQNNIKVLITAITLETLSASLNYFKENNLKYSVLSLNVAEADFIGAYSLMKAQNPIFLISGDFKNA